MSMRGSVAAIQTTRNTHYWQKTLFQEKSAELHLLLKSSILITVEELMFTHQGSLRHNIYLALVK